MNAEVSYDILCTRVLTKVYENSTVKIKYNNFKEIVHIR